MNASEYARNLRTIADALDKSPSTDVLDMLTIRPGFEGGRKENFLALAKVFPRPATAIVENEGTSFECLSLVHGPVKLQIETQEISEIVEPARHARYKYPAEITGEESGIHWEA